MTQSDTDIRAAGEEQSPARLRRAVDDRVIAGVCGGLGRYFGADPVWFRVAFVVLTVGGGSGVLLYLVAWLVIPEQGPGDTATTTAATIGEHGPIIAGIALTAVGLMLLIDNLVPWFDRVMWPMVVIAAGLALLFTGSRHAGRN